ncbi:MAG: hypothetical protein ACXABY_19855 [Candidatus Thorarchaeota archaeon]|jgi:hypothetical protein
MTLDSSVKQDNTNEQLQRLERLGVAVTPSQALLFAELVRSTIPSGVVNISDWTFDAVRTLLIVCKERNLSITLKNGDRYTTPVRYPDGPMLDSLAQAILDGKL